MTNYHYLLLWCFFCYAWTRSSACNDDQVMCSDGQKCITVFSDLCDGVMDCLDESDEDETICKFFTEFKTTISFFDNGYNNCHNNHKFNCDSTCKYLVNCCSTSNDRHNLNLKSENFCGKITSDGRLLVPPKPAPTSNQTYEEILKELQFSYNLSSCNLTSDQCPPLFTKVAGKCISFFSVAKVTWFDANNFCQSINGRLGVFSEVVDFLNLVTHFKNKGFNSDFWLGGLYTQNIAFDYQFDWYWTDGTVMPMGAPFWALTSRNETTQCSSKNPLEEQKCLQSNILPAENTIGYCAASTFQNHYYFSDHSCYDSKSPLCVYNQQ